MGSRPQEQIVRHPSHDPAIHDNRAQILARVVIKPRRRAPVERSRAVAAAQGARAGAMLAGSFTHRVAFGGAG